MLENGDYVGIDVTRGNVVIGEKGFDGTNTDFVEIITKALNLQGKIVGNDVRIVTGENKVSANGEIIEKTATNPSSIAIDGSELGSMYAGQIKIIATEKGAGVNNKAYIVSKNNPLEISADGKIVVNKVQGKGIKIEGEEYEQKEMAYSDKGIEIKGKNITLLGKGTYANENIKLDGNVLNSGQIYTKGNLETKDLVTSGDVQATGNINVEGVLNNSGSIQGSNKLNVKNNGINSGTLQMLDRVTFGGNLTNSGDINVVKEITVDKNVKNTGIILTNSSFSAKDTKTTNKMVAIGEINIKNLINEGELATKSKLNVDGSLENKKNIQTVDNITVSLNVKNDGIILTDSNFSSKDIDNTNTLIVRENISSGAVDNSGIFRAGKDLTVNGSVNNSKTIEAVNIDITGTSLTNTSNIKADNITTTVNIIENDGEILALNNIILNTKKLDNTKKIGALENIVANNTVLTNLGEIVSNKKIELNNSDISNSNKILSNTIEMKNATNFNNTGTIKGTDVTLTTKKDINLIANLHGENSLIIEGNNIVNDGNTTGKNLISIKSNDFTNKKELSSKDLKIEASGDILNENILSATDLNIKAKNLTNNDLIASENDLNIEVKNTLTNPEAKTIYAGNNLNIKAGSILNDKGELIGENIDLDANYIKNKQGTIQAVNTMNIKVGKLENIGLVKGFDEYTSFYETWDVDYLSEEEVKKWFKNDGDSDSAIDAAGEGRSKVRKSQRNKYNEIAESMARDKYPSLLFSKYENEMRKKLGNDGGTVQAKSSEILKYPLKERLISNAETVHGKILANNNINITAKEILNSDSIISTKADVNIRTDNLENVVTTTKNPIEVKSGEELMSMSVWRKEPKLDDPIPEAFMNINYSRRYAQDVIYEPIYEENDRGHSRIVDYKRIYRGRYGYVTGKPSVIEGQNVNIEATNIVKQDIDEANGRIRVEKPVIIPEVIEKTVAQGNTNINETVKITEKEIKNEIDIKESIEKNSILNKKEVYSNVKEIEEIKKNGEININPILLSSLFVKNDSPTSKYLMETRVKYTTLSNYYGSDYFLEKINYKDKIEKYDRVRRLGDAFYENQLVERAVIEKLGTRFLNGEAISMKQLIDNAELEARNQNLTIGQALTKEQISKLNKDIIWYEYKDVNGVKVLAPKVYLSKNTLANIKADGRSRIEGTKQISIKTKIFDNTALIGNKGTTYIEAKSIVNRNFGDQIGEITGDRISLVAENSIFNIGSKMYATDELNLTSKKGNILNQSTITETNRNYGELNRTRHTEIENIAEISSNNNFNISANNYTSIAAKTNAKNLNIEVKEAVNISSQKLSGEQKFGRDENNFSAYSFEKNIGSNVNAENINIEAKNLNITGSAVLAKEAVVDVEKVNIDSNVDKIDRENRAKTKKTFSSRSKTEIQHSEENVAGTLYVENKATINGDVNVVGSNLFLGKDSYVDGNLTTDSKATYNKYILEEKKKEFSFNVGSGGFNLSYGKNQFNYDEKDKTNIKSNIVLGDGSVLNKGAEITATNFRHGNITINNGDVVYGARKDERDVKISTKSSSFGISANVSSPALERIKQGANTIKQIQDGDVLGGVVNVGNVITGTVEGLAGNQGSKQSANNGDARTKDEVNRAKANNDFYVGASINVGYNKSKQESKSHTEKAVVTNITGLDENAKITYNDNKNVKYEGTQASDTSFVYNNVENVTKEAVKLENEYSSKGSTFGVGIGASISLSPSMNKGAQGGNSAYGANSASVAVNASGSVNRLNSEEIIYENGKFTNVNEVHNNTGTMKLLGFNQEGGSVTGTIKNLEIESKQNRSKTDGYTAGGNILVGITNAGAVSGNVHGSLTDGDRAFVDNQSTFVIGENSNLKIGNVDNIASIIGTTDNGKISIDSYVGKNLENSDKLTTVGGAIGTSGVGVNYSNKEKEGITRNTVIGNVEIEKTSGDTINRDLKKANEITKDSSTKTDVFVESQLIRAVQNPDDFKEKVSLAKQEIKDLETTVLNTIDNKGKDERNFIELLSNQRRATTLNNLLGNDISNILENSGNIQEDFSILIENFGKDLGIDVKVNYTDTKGMPLESKDKGGTARLDGANGKIYINTDKIKDTSDLVGTAFEELSHIIDGVAGRKKETTEEEKKQGEHGLESLGRPINDYFKEQYLKNSKSIELKSEGDFTFASGENVGDKTVHSSLMASDGSGGSYVDKDVWKAVKEYENSRRELENDLKGIKKLESQLLLYLTKEEVDKYNKSSENEKIKIISQKYQDNLLKSNCNGKCIKEEQLDYEKNKQEALKCKGKECLNKTRNTKPLLIFKNKDEMIKINEELKILGIREKYYLDYNANVDEKNSSMNSNEVSQRGMRKILEYEKIKGSNIVSPFMKKEEAELYGGIPLNLSKENLEKYYQKGIINKLELDTVSSELPKMIEINEISKATVQFVSLLAGSIGKQNFYDPSLEETGLLNYKKGSLEKVKGTSIDANKVRRYLENNKEKYISGGARKLERTSISVAKITTEKGKVENILPVSGKSWKGTAPNEIKIDGVDYKVVRNDSQSVKTYININSKGNSDWNYNHAEKKIASFIQDNYKGQKIEVEIGVQNTSGKYPGMCVNCKKSMFDFAKDNPNINVKVYEGTTGVNK